MKKTSYLIILIMITVTMSVNANKIAVTGNINQLDSGKFTLIERLKSLKDHIKGDVVLTNPDFLAIKTEVEKDADFFKTDYDVMSLAFEVVALYENLNGGLFTRGTTTFGGYNRSAANKKFENLILEIMQSILTHSYTEHNIESYPNLFKNYLFKTSSYFPGAVSPPENSKISYKVDVNATHLKQAGTQDNYYLKDARRPTGCYLAPGSIVKIKVPSKLVGVGASILVGAHTWDFSKKRTVKRMDKVTKLYLIEDGVVTIANPLGGGIYVNIPLGLDLGKIQVTIENAVKSPYYANTSIKSTTLKEWQNTERKYPAPWADFETERYMMQVPTSWIYAWDDPSKTLQDWDDAMDAISTIHGRALVRSKTPMYQQVDLLFRANVFAPGYPMVNHAYNPYNTHTSGNFIDHVFLAGPTSYVNNIDVVYHEMGHGERIPKFRGEMESYVNLLWVAVQNRAFKMNLNEALASSRNYKYGHSIDEAAISWMITENFRKGIKMSSKTGNSQHEFGYQYRGHAKYVDIVRLFDWEPIINFYLSVSDDYETKGIEYPRNNDPTDSRILRMSIASGYDLRPLIHFWGIHPIDASVLDASIKDANLTKSTAIYDVLQHYKTLVPKNNEKFKAFALSDFTLAEIKKASYKKVPKSYGPAFFKAWWDIYDSEDANEAIRFIDSLINLYFPDGRPEDKSISCSNVIGKDVDAKWSVKGDEEFIILDLGELYDVCKMEIEFYKNLNLDYSFDVQVSRDNITYAPVFNKITKTKTNSFNLSRKARYIKIVGYGNSTAEFKSIEKILLYGELVSIKRNL
ncbi:M60 family peptidase N-terminal accessory domain-containing protein [Polaribacter sargassicola]|uniref:M60 family peptidase N-terminal accessory domain-containing protein n=1 Tax=Polaribacter sargassicola TaxID=2836891 RepID=UPI001F44CED5|nr:M60 family peptidase N-terminal accessory domain-containing protein [Polaribacter sp. DS7-9]MCG1034769.1 M60 family metallopeptidase [Polaribacter sp. DS7-9]